MIRPYDGKVGAFAYATKNEFIQRVSLAPSAQDEIGENVEQANMWATARPSFRAPDKPRNTRNKALTIAQNADVALFLDALGSDRRHLLIGFQVERNENGEGENVIRPTVDAMAEAERRAEGNTNPNDSDNGEANNEPDDHGDGNNGEQWDGDDRAWLEGREHGDAEGGQEPDDDEDHEEGDEEEWDDNEWHEDTDDESEGDDEDDGERQTRPGQRDPISQRWADEANIRAWVNTLADHYRAQARMRGQELSDAQVIKMLEARLKAMPRT